MFEPREHSERPRRSAERLDVQIPVSAEELCAAKALCVARNGDPDVDPRLVACAARR